MEHHGKDIVILSGSVVQTIHKGIFPIADGAVYGAFQPGAICIIEAGIERLADLRFHLRDMVAPGDPVIYHERVRKRVGHLDGGGCIRIEIGLVYQLRRSAVLYPHREEFIQIALFVQINVLRKAIDQLVALGKGCTALENDIGLLRHDPPEEQRHIIVLLDNTGLDTGILGYPEDHLLEQRSVIVQHCKSLRFRSNCASPYPEKAAHRW